MIKLKYFVETQVFGVCTYLGEKLGIASSKIRLFFIYISFITLGSPIILYMILAFLIRLKDYIKSKVNPVWDR